MLLKKVTVEFDFAKVTIGEDSDIRFEDCDSRSVVDVDRHQFDLLQQIHNAVKHWKEKHDKETS